MKLSRLAVAIGIVSLGLVGVLRFRVPNRPVPSKRPVKPSAIRVAEPETPEPVVPPVAIPLKTESVLTPASEAPEDAAATEIAMTPEVAEFCAMLELSEEIASRAMGLLGERDLAAERILEVYDGRLTAEAIVAVQPRLRMLDEETDRAVEALLTLDQQRRYRGLRDEHFIPGTMLEPPPAQLPDLDADE